MQLGTGNMIMAGAIINADSTVKNHCIINSQSVIEHDNTIEDYCNIAPGVITGGGVKVERLVNIYLGVKIIPKITIGKNSTIGAGSLVLKDIPPNTKCFGHPVKSSKNYSLSQPNTSKR